jgi:hypothetical protein
LWLYLHGLALCAEYTYRYDKTHACEKIIRQLGEDNACVLKQLPNYNKPIQFVLAMPEDLKNNQELCANPVQAYRTYLKRDKAYYCRWTKRNQPIWW